MSSNTVIALATVVNVVVTAVYALFTWRLWQETKRQAQLTGQQAVQTHEIFEATRRPWVSIEPFQLYAFTELQVRLEFRLHNHGSSPAFVNRWVHHWNPDSSEHPPLTADTPADSVNWCVIPNGNCEALPIKFGDPRKYGVKGAASKLPRSTLALISICAVPACSRRSE